MNDVIKFNIPWPPTANGIWRKTNNGIVYLSQQYKRFKNEVEAVVKERFGTLDRVLIPEGESVRLEILLHPPTNMDYDADNRVKPTQDALTSAGLWANDNQIKRVEAEKIDFDKNKKGFAEITIWRNWEGGNEC